MFGSVDGSLKKFFSKVQKILAKQEFSFAIVLGDLFAQNPNEAQLQEVLDLANGAISVPLPTYFGLGNNALPVNVRDKIEQSEEVCSNLFFLGKRGTLKTSEGIRIAALGGWLSASGVVEGSEPDPCQPTFQLHDARTLYGAHSTDILVTNQWPQGVRSGSKHSLPDGIEAPSEEQCIADLCATLKPRYHFAPSGAYYSREPFFYPSTESESEKARVTRFEAIAPFSNARKEKWFYAFKLDPDTAAPFTLPSDITSCPFPVTRNRRALQDQKESYSRYAPNKGDRRPAKRQRQSDYTKLENCFFCISSPVLQTHLITSMADESYLTIPKGPLPPPGSNAELGIPGHALIIPHTHVDDNVPVEERAHVSVAEYDEMQKYRQALCRMIQAKANGKMGAVTWEISRSHIRHVHWQFLPVPWNLVSKGLVQAAFKVAAENGGLPTFQKHDPTKMMTDKGDYFRVWVWKPAGAGNVPGLAENEDEAVETSMVMAIPSSDRFDVQFGRRIMAQLLGLGDRADWHNVVQTEDEEKADAEAFKTAFEPYDPSLEAEAK